MLPDRSHCEFPLNELITESGIRYPLRQSLGVVVKVIGDSLKAYFPQVDSLESLTSEGFSEKPALKNFTAGFHRLVETHVRKPPHLQTPDDEMVKGVLDSLIDWDEFHRLNPIEQPMWGCIQSWLKDGAVTIHWILGPDDERDEESTLRPQDVCDALREIAVGHWFYGGALVFPNHIQWTELPVEVPNPRDKEAIRQVWESIPTTVMSDANAWPMRGRGRT